MIFIRKLVEPESKVPPNSDETAIFPGILSASMLRRYGNLCANGPACRQRWQTKYCKDEKCWLTNKPINNWSFGFSSLREACPFCIFSSPLASRLYQSASRSLLLMISELLLFNAAAVSGSSCWMTRVKWFEPLVFLAWQPQGLLLPTTRWFCYDLFLQNDGFHRFSYGFPLPCCHLLCPKQNPMPGRSACSERRHSSPPPPYLWDLSRTTRCCHQKSSGWWFEATW